MIARTARPLLLVVAVLGCSTPSPRGAPSSSAPAGVAPSSAAATVEEVREGTLEVSKGNPALAGALLPHGVVKRAFGDNWTSVALGKRVRARGTLRIHRCGPQEQCLISGEIPIFEATSIELVDAPK
jgi:hypothetical protein